MKKAFTLIELLIVIAIIGILAGILFVSIGQRPLISARDGKRVSDLQALRTALNLYYTDNAAYPATGGLAAALIPNYTPSLPSDPRDDQPDTTACGTAYTPNFPGGPYIAGDYGYAYKMGATTNQSYILQGCLEDTSNPVLISDCDDTSLDPPCMDTPVNIYDIHS